MEEEFDVEVELSMVELLDVIVLLSVIEELDAEDELLVYV